MFSMFSLCVLQSGHWSRVSPCLLPTTAGRGSSTPPQEAADIDDGQMNGWNLRKENKLGQQTGLSSLSLFLCTAAEEVLLEEEDEIAVEKSPLDGAWYKRKQNLPGES